MEWSQKKDRRKMFGNKKFVDMFLLLKCQTSFCRNFGANKQIPCGFTATLTLL